MAAANGTDAIMERRVTEIELLKAMYPELEWDEQRQELKYTAEGSASLLLRVPDDYPGASRPTLISASHKDKTDLRNMMKSNIDDLNLPPDEEIIDAIIQAFEETLQAHPKEVGKAKANRPKDTSTHGHKCKTIIIWLHHLLNINKRKLALNPTLDAEQVMGLTKPGYPGILLYTGDTAAVDAHVSELKTQRWQAFQVRFEESMPAPWSFAHSSGIREVKSMSEVVQEIPDEKNQQAFLKAVGVK